MSAPTWLDRNAYPFELRRFAHGDGELAYVDEGPRDEGPDDGVPLVFVHGNPSWSFMYRRQIADLSDNRRCLALDHLGFGLSDKPADASYHPACHAERLGAWLDHLGVGEVHLVVHDWGGPIGLGWALHHPERIRSLFVLNTWMWSLKDQAEARRFSGTLSSWPAQFAIRRLGAFVRQLMPRAFADKAKFRAVASQYRGPFAQASERAGVADFPRQLMQADDFLDSLWQRRRLLADKPATLVWALRDPVFRKPALERWQEILPQAPVHKIPDIGHYVAEEMGSELSPHIAEHLADHDPD